VNPLDILRTIGGKMGGGSRYPELSHFMQGDARNAWVETGPYNAYLRKGLPGQVDLANIERMDLRNFEPGGGNTHELPPEARPPRGDFTGFMAELERAATEAGYDRVYVENIMNEFLPGVLERLGYQTADNSMPGIPSMIKELR
jgi:hypothetical protein